MSTSLVIWNLNITEHYPEILLQVSLKKETKIDGRGHEIFIIIILLMICHKPSNVIFLFMLMIHALFVNLKILMKFKKKLNEDSENIFDWFVDNNLSIHFDDDKTTSILFETKFKIKKVRQLNMKYGIHKSNRISKLNI